MGKTFGISFALGAVVSPSVSSAFKTVKEKAQGLKSQLSTLRATASRAEAVVKTGAELSGLKAQRKAAPQADHAMLDARIDEVKAKWERATVAAGKHGLSVAKCATVYKGAAAEITRAEAALGRFQTRQANAAKRQELQGQIVGTVGTVMAAAAPIKLAVDFESSFADAKKVMDDFKDDEIAKMPKDIRALSVETGLAASGIAGIYTAAASGKFAKSREELSAFAGTAAKMAVAFGMTADESGQRMASWRSKMGLSQQEVVALADAVNHLGNNMNADPLKTSEVIERVGAVAKVAGLATNQIAALGATFVAASPSPEIAATGMKNFLLALSKGTAMSSDQQESFKRLGFDPKTLAKDMQADAEGTILRVLSALQRMPEAEQGALLSEMFGTESLGAIAPMLQNLDQLKGAFANVAKAESYAGSMQKEYESRSATTGNAWNRARRSAESLGIVAGTVLLPAISAVMGGTVALLTPVTALAEQFPMVTTVVMGSVVALALLKVGALAGGYAATVVSDGWAIAKGIFAALHPQVIATNVALLWQRTVAIATAVGLGIQTAATWTATVAMRAFGIAATFALGPIGLVIGLAAAGAALIVANWESIGPVVKNLWSSVVGWASEAWDSVKGIVTGVVDWIVGYWTKAFDVVAAPFRAVASFMGGGSAEKAPSASSTPNTPASAASPGPATITKAAGAGGGINITFGPFTFQGDTNGGQAVKDQVIEALRLSAPELKRMIADIMHDERRLAYG